MNTFCDTDGHIVCLLFAVGISLLIFMYSLNNFFPAIPQGRGIDVKVQYDGDGILMADGFSTSILVFLTIGHLLGTIAGKALVFKLMSDLPKQFGYLHLKLSFHFVVFNFIIPFLAPPPPPPPPMLFQMTLKHLTMEWN